MKKLIIAEKPSVAKNIADATNIHMGVDVGMDILKGRII